MELWVRAITFAQCVFSTNFFNSFEEVPLVRCQLGFFDICDVIFVLKNGDERSQHHFTSQRFVSGGGKSSIVRFDAKNFVSGEGTDLGVLTVVLFFARVVAIHNEAAAAGGDVAWQSDVRSARRTLC